MLCKARPGRFSTTVLPVKEDKPDIARTINLPSDLLDDLPNESGALAQVTLGARDTGLNDARGGLLYCGKQTGNQLFNVHRPRLP